MPTLVISEATARLLIDAMEAHCAGLEEYAGYTGEHSTKAHQEYMKARYDALDELKASVNETLNVNPNFQQDTD
jgi:hypothetical protein